MPSKLANIIFLSMDVMVEDSLVATSTRKQWKTPCKSTYRHVMAFHRSYSFYDELHPISGLHFCSSIAFASHSSMSYMYTHILLCMTLDMCTSRLLWAPEHLMQMKKTKSHWSAFHLQIHQTIPIRFHALHVWYLGGHVIIGMRLLPRVQVLIVAHLPFFRPVGFVTPLATCFHIGGAWHVTKRSSTTIFLNGSIYLPN